MTNKDVSKQLKLLGQLKELHGENAFRTKTYANASFQVGRYSKPLIESTVEEISSIPGIGKSMVQKIVEALENGVITGLDDYLIATPTGVLEMLEVKGLGSSKARVLWKAYEIDSVSKLLQACEENRLINIKGFGEKTQEKIKEAIHFKNENLGKMLYAEAEALALGIARELQAIHPEENAIFLTGELYTKEQIVNELSFAVVKTSTQKEIEQIVADIKGPIKISVTFLPRKSIPFYLLSNSSHPLHIKVLGLNERDKEKSQEEIYAERKLPFIIPEMRNGTSEFEWAKKYSNEQIIKWEHLKGAVHNHSTYSDGIHSIAQMAKATKDLGLDYFGIADHSKTAVYANGLSEERLEKQWEEIDQLNSDSKDFTIFKGIESDILNDGSLDYSDEVLAKFDYVVASVHSGMNMNEEKATSRLIKAIEHPSTNILGHLSTRLLLRRPGYPLDYPKVIEACIVNKVAIEINANPWRLDIDWTYVYEAMEKGAYFSINPDAHKMEGLKDMQYGIYVARKAGLIKERVINTFSTLDIKEFFQK